MAGIGEVSAIVTVAALGISLSTTLITYIGEVKDASGRIQLVSNEVLSASERLKEVGELVAKNPQTNFFNQEGLRSAKRCSDECGQVVGTVRQLLQKSGWVQQSQVVQKDEIDISLFSSFRWPFIKTKLEVPRAELQRIKTDLILLYTSAMALGATAAADQEKYKLDIPGLQKTRDWYAKQAERAKLRAQDAQREPHAYRDGLRYEADDKEMLRKFMEFEERHYKEMEEKRFKERAAFLEAERKKRKEEEEEVQRKLQEKAVADFVKKQEELKMRKDKYKEILRKEIANLPVGLTLDQISAVIEKFNLNDDEYTSQFDQFANLKTVESTNASAAETSEPKIKSSSSRFRLGIRAFWKHPRKRKGSRGKVRAESAELVSEDDRNVRAALTLKAWTIDASADRATEIWLPQSSLQRRLSAMSKKQDPWNTYSLLNSQARTALYRFLDSENDKATEDGEEIWTLLLIEVPRSLSKGLVLQVIIGRNELTKSHSSSALEPDTVVEVLEKEGTSRGRTTVPERLVLPEVLIKRGLDFEKRRDKYVIRKPLSKATIDEIISVSRQIKKGSKEQADEPQGQPQSLTDHFPAPIKFRPDKNPRPPNSMAAEAKDFKADGVDPPNFSSNPKFNPILTQPSRMSSSTRPRAPTQPSYKDAEPDHHDWAASEYRPSESIMPESDVYRGRRWYNAKGSYFEEPYDIFARDKAVRFEQYPGPVDQYSDWPYQAHPPDKVYENTVDREPAPRASEFRWRQRRQSSPETITRRYRDLGSTHGPRDNSTISHAELGQKDHRPGHANAHYRDSSRERIRGTSDRRMEVFRPASSVYSRPNTKKPSYDERDWALVPLKHPHENMFESYSSEDEGGWLANRRDDNDDDKAATPPLQTDEDIITNTLKRYTTFDTDPGPSVAPQAPPLRQDSRSDDDNLDDAESDGSENLDEHTPQTNHPSTRSGPRMNGEKSSNGTQPGTFSQTTQHLQDKKIPLSLPSSDLESEDIPLSTHSHSTASSPKQALTNGSNEKPMADTED